MTLYNARAQSLFHSLNRLFGGVFVAVAAVVCFSSLVFSTMAEKTTTNSTG